jgi:hypothetical protein
MPKLLREQGSRFRSNSFIMPGPAKAKASYYPIWLILREEREEDLGG